MAVRTLRLYTAEGCPPCESLKAKLRAGEIPVEGLPEGDEAKIEEVDVTTEAGFALAQALQIEQVPSAYLEDTPCKILVDEDDVTFISCPMPPAPA